MGGCSSLVTVHIQTQKIKKRKTKIEKNDKSVWITAVDFQ